MPLNKDIRKATSLNSRDKNTEVLRLQGLSQAERDRKMNEGKVAKPKNIHLIETCDQTDDDTINTDIIVTTEVNRKFDRHEVSAAIKEVNGGVDLSNKYWEQYWSNHLVDAIPPVEELERFSLHSDAKTYSENYFKDKDLFPHRPVRNINLTNRLRRNAAIMGLVKMKNISLEEMIDPNYNDFAKTKNKMDDLHQHKTSTLASNDTTNNVHHVESIPLPDDPEVFVHPLQMGLDKNKFQDIDFSLPRLGKKVIVSPSEFFLEANKDEFFDFVKSHKKDET